MVPNMVLHMHKHNINVYNHVQFDMNDNVFWFESSF